MIIRKSDDVSRTNSFAFDDVFTRKCNIYRCSHVRVGNIPTLIRKNYLNLATQLSPGVQQPL